MQGTPWGHKVTISIYIEGKRPRGSTVAEAARDAALALELDDNVIDAGGARIEPVEDRPIESIAS